MAKKVQKKPSKKTQTKGAAKTKKVAAKAKKAAAPAKKTKAPANKAAAPAKKAKSPAKKEAAPKKAAAKSTRSAKSFSVTDFAGMTYLTENGVKHWLRQGLLKGHQNDKGEWQIDASNLEVPNVKRLVR